MLCMVSGYFNPYVWLGNIYVGCGGGGKFRKFTVSIVCLVFIHILNCKMTYFSEFVSFYIFLNCRLA